jgi:hypothetical protein
MIVNSRLDQMCMHNIPPEHPEKFKDIKESNQSLKIPKRVIWQDHGQYNDIKWSTKHYTETKKWPMLNLLTQGMKSGIKRKRKQTKNDNDRQFLLKCMDKASKVTGHVFVW